MSYIYIPDLECPEALRTSSAMAPKERFHLVTVITLRTGNEQGTCALFSSTGVRWENLPSG